MASTTDASGVPEKTGFGAAAASFAERFQVTKTEELPQTGRRLSHTVDIDVELEDTPLPSEDKTKSTKNADVHVVFDSIDNKTLFTDKMELYDEEEKSKSVKTVLYRYVHAGSIKGAGQEPKLKADLGVILGVFFPCLQNIFGVIYFVRLYWIVGEAGSIEAFFIVFSCCCVSLLTSLSISAVATNGKVPGGGLYVLISRSLGPEFGGAVGILFYFGISISVAMYLAGSIELMLQYIAPELNISEDRYNNARLYGTALLLLVSAAVFTGVKFVSKFAMVVLFSVLIAIVSVYIGMFVANPENSMKVCFLGDVLLSSEAITVNGTLMCTKNSSGPLYKLWCKNDTGCNPYFTNHDVEQRAGVPGLSAHLFAENAGNKYGEVSNIIGTSHPGDTERGEITRDLSTSFVVLLAIYFPSITGFEQGSSYSGDLKDAQKAIPRGTLWAVFVTSVVYLSTVLLFSATVDGSVLRDKFGASIGHQLIMSQLSWPSPWVILIGALMSTVGAGLQALTAAPRLLQAIAKDNVFPILHRFSYMTNKGEPIPAIAFSVVIAEVGILIAKLDYVAPIVTMFFLICYGFVNFACALQSLLRTPHWRPRFRFYHWTLALLGLALCLTLMILSSWYYTLLALTLASCIYKYIEYKGAEQEWGDGMRGLAMSAARYALLRLKEDVFEGSTKNWRPQLLVLSKVDSDLNLMYPRVLSLASQLKAGKGLTILGCVIQGDFTQLIDDCKETKVNLMNSMEQEQVKGFTKVVASESISQGLCHVIQSAGLGALHPNMVMVCWPDHWFDSMNRETYKAFMDTLHYAKTADLAIQLVKGIQHFPSNADRLEGFIDIWWIMNDGSMLIMLAFLLVQHKVWKNCKLRIFTVAQISDNSVQMKNDLQQYMYNLRIPAKVEVVEMEDKDISAYIYERTLKMEERTRLLNAMNMKRKESMKVVDIVVDRAHRPSTLLHPIAGVSHSTPAFKPTHIDQLKVDTASVRLRHHSAEEQGTRDWCIQSRMSPDSEGSVQYTFSPEILHKSDTHLSVDKPHVMHAFTDAECLPESDTSNNMANELAPDGSEDYSSGKHQSTRVDWDENHPLIKVKLPKTTCTSQSNSDAEYEGNIETHFISKAQRKNMRKMHTAVRLNQMIRQRSDDTQLIVLNLPCVPNNTASQANYMHFLEVLQEGLERVLMIRGTGREVITMYN